MKRISTILIAMALVMGSGVVGAHADGEQKKVLYLEDGFEEVSPQGCVYYSSLKNRVFSKDGLYNIPPSKCKDWKGRWAYWAKKYQTKLGEWRENRVKSILRGL